MPQRPEGSQSSGLWYELRRRGLLPWVLAGLFVVLLAVIIVIVVVSRSSDAGENDGTGSAAGGSVVVTSPYDFSEMSADKGPADAAKASYVSILLVEGPNDMTSYGLKRTVSAAEALILAVVAAKEAGDSGQSSAGDGAEDGDDGTLRSSLTFRFDDMSTLTFDLDLDNGLIARDGRAWKVKGDLDALIQNAIAAVQG